MFTRELTIVSTRSSTEQKTILRDIAIDIQASLAVAILSVSSDVIDDTSLPETIVDVATGLSYSIDWFLIEKETAGKEVVVGSLRLM